jgi:FkbM family methyltransferase
MNVMSIMIIRYERVGKELLAIRSYEAVPCELVSKLVKPGMVFIDMEAHIGRYTPLASSLVGNQGQVQRFEPDPETHAILRNNLTLNNLTNVTANQLALTDSDGIIDYYQSRPPYAGGGSTRPCDGARRWSVRGTTMRGYLAQTHLDILEFIKMDVEGDETHV